MHVFVDISTYVVPDYSLAMESGASQPLESDISLPTESNASLPTIESDLSHRPSINDIADVEEGVLNKSVRRREVDTTEHERIQLLQYSQQDPKSTQNDLVQWFSNSFHKQVNQSTISRICYHITLHCTRLIMIRHFKAISE